MPLKIYVWGVDVAFSRQGFVCNVWLKSLLYTWPSLEYSIFIMRDSRHNGYLFQVKQLLAVDGRLHLDFGIAPTLSSQNYTRSYYMNGRDYIISGSCDEHVVRICCAQTGRRLRDISLEVN